MDSRIREIEQWISEAKADLGERGREAYLNKLYLLDAEIRSVIRENGMQPGAASPQTRDRRVRRQHAIPAFASGAALSALLLAASTVYFASPGISLPWSRPKPAASTRLVAQAPSGQELALAAGGEERIFTSADAETQSHPLNDALKLTKRGEGGATNPPVMQAPGAEVSLNGNSKPSALAHPSAPAPASTSPKPAQPRPLAPKPAASPAPPPVIMASLPAAAPQTAPAMAKLPAKNNEATAVELLGAQPVHNRPADNGDSEHKLDLSALTKTAEDSLKGR